jgi:diaminohydroxyphosphoribosylaminopyrimidine deaminase / 5-amino-6-(5-phosphoribosylamino)uracil reductase
VPARRRMFDDAAPTLVATTEDAPVARRREWEAAGAEVDVLDASDDGVSLDALLDSLGKREVQGALLEGGPSLAWSAIAAGAVDKVVLYVAPMLVGGRDAPGILGGTGLAPIGEAVRAEIHDVELIDGDLRVEAYVHRDR